MEVNLTPNLFRKFAKTPWKLEVNFFLYINIEVLQTAPEHEEGDAENWKLSPGHEVGAVRRQTPLGTIAPLTSIYRRVLFLTRR